jgi:Rad3-related DNA helicase
MQGHGIEKKENMDIDEKDIQRDKYSDGHEENRYEIERTKADNTDTALITPKGEVRVSVRNLVEFVLRNGDIDNRRRQGAENAMQEGSRIHRMIQKRMGADYQSEVFLRYTEDTDKYRLVVEGRADGIIDNKDGIVIDEIKGTYRDLVKMKEPAPLHVAQAKCYAYMYGLKKQCDSIRIRMTYCNMESEELKYFYLDFMFSELAEWFAGLLQSYRKWADYSWEWRILRQQSIEKMKFPFDYRDGQRELVTHVYSTIYHKRKLFLEAPTGAGKTISTIFPAVKAMGKGMGERIFYLTAKTITRTVAEDTFEILRSKGLRFKSVVLTAKEKICFTEEKECNPESCPYAKGHFDRINDAMYEMLTQEESFTREVIERYAEKYMVCPFELCLDMSLFADGIIGDYNYLFDPHVYLKRFFGDGNGGDYLFLIDEAHNLLERGREMYSASLLKEDFMTLKRSIKQTVVSELSEKNRKSQVSGQMTLELTNNVTDNMTEEQLSVSESESDIQERLYGAEDYDDSVYVGKGKGRKKHHGAQSILVREGYGELLIQQLDLCNKELLELKRECESVQIVEEIDDFTQRLSRLYSTMSDYLGEQEEIKLPVREEILDFYFEVGHFLETYELVDEHYVKYTQLGEDSTFMIKLFCVNPRENLKECMMRGRSTILFSATFLPIMYYKELLGGDAQDYEVYAKSVFNPEKRGLYIANDVTSKYTRRSDEEYYRIAQYIEKIVGMRQGNYMVFCPSYSFMHKVYDLYIENFASEDKECIMQQDYMSEADREDFLGRFRRQSEDAVDITLIGFCVLGGIFSEGIDLKNDSLIGAVIVGTGLPQVCTEREIIKDYFDKCGDNGFDYAYRFPGMNKVLQAAGRVIRTSDDIGIVTLLDERFLQYSYRKLFPREWEYFEEVNVKLIDKRIEHFWDSWSTYN